MGYKYNGGNLALDVPFKDTAGTSYPANWLRLSTEDQRKAVPGGITWEDPKIDRIDERFFNSDKSEKKLSDVKPFWIQQQKNQAEAFLNSSDWMAIRASEGGTAIPSDYKTYRAAVRTKSKEREDQITAASDINTLRNLIDNDEYKGASGGLKNWPVKP